MLTCITGALLALASLYTLYLLLLIKVQGYITIHEPVPWVLTTEVILVCLILGLSIATIIDCIWRIRYGKL